MLELPLTVHDMKGNIVGLRGGGGGGVTLMAGVAMEGSHWARGIVDGH